MTSRNKLAYVAAIAHIMTGENPFTENNSLELERIEIQPRVPKGAKEYFFNEFGEFSTESMLKSETVFICWAINDKNAIRKFNKRNNKTTDQS